MTELLAGKEVELSSLIEIWIRFFWILAQSDLKRISEFIRSELKEQLIAEVERAKQRLSNRTSRFVSVVLTDLTLSATSLQHTCESVADWFNTTSSAITDHVHLSEAIEIAIQSIKNVYPQFHIKVKVDFDLETNPSLGFSALNWLRDALFIMLENAIKHSGTVSTEREIELSISNYEDGHVTLTVSNSLEFGRVAEIQNIGLDVIRKKLILEDNKDLIGSEGGSGLTKLAWLSTGLSGTYVGESVSIDVVGSTWNTTARIPVLADDLGWLENK